MAENEEEVKEVEEPEVVVEQEVSSGLVGILQILANKISKKASVIGLAMVLIYMLAATPTTPELIFPVAVLALLAVFFTMLQWILDKKQAKVILKIKQQKANEKKAKDTSTKEG